MRENARPFFPCSEKDMMMMMKLRFRSHYLNATQTTILSFVGLFTPTEIAHLNSRRQIQYLTNLHKSSSLVIMAAELTS